MGISWGEQPLLAGIPLVSVGAEPQPPQGTDTPLRSNSSRGGGPQNPLGSPMGASPRDALGAIPEGFPLPGGGVPFPLGGAPGGAVPGAGRGAGGAVLPLPVRRGRRRQRSGAGAAQSGGGAGP